MNKRLQIAYLNSALEDYDVGAFLLALREIVVANGGISTLSKKTELNRENLYRMLSTGGNPTLESLMLIFRTLGFKLEVKENKNE